MNTILATLLLAASKSVPSVVAGVEYLSKEASSATKQQLALDSLTVLTSTAAAAFPEAAPVASEINSVLSAMINLTVAGFNAAGTFTHKAATSAS